VRDRDRAVRFYVETLDMKLVEDGGSGLAVIDGGDGFLIGLHESSATERRGASAASVGLYPKVPLHEAVAILENRGIEFEVKDAGPVTLAHFCDPDDNVLYLSQER